MFDNLSDKLDGVFRKLKGHGKLTESNIEEGSQPFVYGETRKEDLNPFVSITDACIGWEETEDILLTAHGQLQRKSGS